MESKYNRGFIATRLVAGKPTEEFGYFVVSRGKAGPVIPGEYILKTGPENAEGMWMFHEFENMYMSVSTGRRVRIINEDEYKEILDL